MEHLTIVLSDMPKGQQGPEEVEVGTCYTAFLRGRFETVRVLKLLPRAQVEIKHWDGEAWLPEASKVPAVSLWYSINPPKPPRLNKEPQQ